MSRSSLALAIAALALPALSLVAQCGMVTVSGGPIAGVAAPIGSSYPWPRVLASTEWDPDGVGPAAPVVVLGGYFSLAGDIAAQNIVAIDRASGACSAIGAGLSGAVNALVAGPSGELIAGGAFSQGSTWLGAVMRWDGTAWAEVGPGELEGTVEAMVTLANGDLVVGGNLLLTGFPTNSSVARWDGHRWWPLGSGPGYVIVECLAVLPNGDVMAGSGAGMIRWNGVTWVAGPGSWPSNVTGFTLLGNGDLVAVGDGYHKVARFVSGTWTYLPDPPFVPYCVAALPNDDIVIGGSAPSSADSVLRWDGVSWTPLGGSAPRDSSIGEVRHLARSSNGDLIAGGLFQAIQGVGASRVARWHNASWSPLVRGTSGSIDAMVEAANGDVIACGAFHELGGVAAHQVARFDGQQWSAIGPGTNGQVSYVLERRNGDLVISGSFTESAGQAVKKLARWNGTAWQAIGSGLTLVGPLAELENGDLIVAGWVAQGGVSSVVARSNGASWVPLGSGLSGIVRALQPAPNGELFVAGLLTLGGSNPAPVVRWNGSVWTAMNGLPVADVRCLALAPTGEVLAGVTASATALVDAMWKWNGTTWSTVGTGLLGRADEIRLLPNGDVLVSGAFLLGGSALTSMARWDGSNWSEYGPVGNAPIELGPVTRSGDIWLTGAFTTLDGVISSRHARLEPQCPASTASLGTGCTSSGGPVELAADSLPWLGSTFRAVATGIPNDALVVGVRGLQATSIPLATLLPQGQPGCLLLASVDLLDVQLPMAGSVFPVMTIPNAMALIGRTMRYQVLPVQFDAAGNVSAVTSSNALSLTFGSL
ncbi:MAG TPA: hypothetical protein VFZ65_00655 [Planctomycetota bacterium]|nr:hypothetical protein [Planctomycetota bacterium]